MPWIWEKKGINQTGEISGMHFVCSLFHCFSSLFFCFCGFGILSWYGFLFLLFAKQGNEGMERKEKKNIFSLLVSEAEER